MSKKKAAAAATRASDARSASGLVVISTGCPASIGPEVAVVAAIRARTRLPRILIGDEATLLDAADLAGMERKRFERFGTSLRPGRVYLLQAGPKLSVVDRHAGRPSARAGAAQLAYIDAAYDLASSAEHRVLVTGPVSKAAIACSKALRAAGFRGHTEWLRDRDRARTAVMCFASRRLNTSLVTTHVPLAAVPKALTMSGVRDATVWLAKMLEWLGKRRLRLAVCSLNPHAGESELLGDEERRFIVPGARKAAGLLASNVTLDVPVGAETAYRKAFAGHYDGVVAIYHDQATIPMKLTSFGEAVNVTMGLSIVRTSVDHGTAYDIAWKGSADASGMLAAIDLGCRLSRRA